MNPGDLVRRIVNPTFGLAIVLRKIRGGHVEILCDDGSTRIVFYDALEVVNEAR